MRYRYRVLGMLFFLSVVTYLDRICIAVAGPRMQADLDLSPEKWGWVLGVFTITYALFEIPSGALGDRLGQRRLLTRIVVWWSVFTSLTGAVSSYFYLLTIRLLFGAGEAGAFPNSSGSIARWFPTVERARAQGVVWMASRVGGALTPLLVVPIQQRYGWRTSFWLLGIMGLIWASVWFAWYKDFPAEKRGVSQKELDEIGAGAQRTAHVGLPWRIALSHPNLWYIVLMYHTYCWGSYFYISWLHTYLQKGRGFSEGQMAMWSTLPFIIGACGNLVGGTVSDLLVKKYGLKLGRRSVGATGLAMAAVFMYMTALTSNNSAAALFLAIGYGCMDCMMPVAWSVCLDVGRKYTGAVTGAMNTGGQAGSFLSAVAFGYIVKGFGSYNAPLFPMATMLVVSAVLFLKIDPTKPLVPEESGESALRRNSGSRGSGRDAAVHQ
jgi:MFS transporter, ACS family, glucarate transporter